jgi:LytS/YehU family sensor histidine kinase
MPPRDALAATSEEIPHFHCQNEAMSSTQMVPRLYKQDRIAHSFAFCTLYILQLLQQDYLTCLYYSNYTGRTVERRIIATNLQTQFDSLKGQVNPHFLFNSLNSLSSLISIDPQKAEQFVEELSSVYRYLLKSNERELNTLKEEISFINSYVYLLTTRFGTI